MSPPSRPVNGRRGRQFTRALRTSRDQGAAPTVVSETRGCVRLPRWVCPRGSRVGANGPRKFWRSRPVSQTDVSAVNSTTRGAAHAPTRWDASSRASGVPPISARIAAPCSRDPRYVPVAPADARSAPVASSCALFFGHALSERRGCPAAPPLDADARIVPHDPAPKIARVHSADPDRHVPS